jgi:endo-1,3-1,4-beta-glycanase ExoK
MEAKMKHILILTGFLGIIIFSAGCATSAKNCCDSQWQLAWQDNFDKFDSNRWEIATHTFIINDSQFVEKNVTFQNGTMKLHLTAEPAGEQKYSGAEYRTKDSYLYGKFEVRMKFAAGSGVVSSFFTYKDPMEPKWNEIDIEVLGKDPNTMQLTHWWDKMPSFLPITYYMGFDATKDFHTYAFEWLPGCIRWTIDGVEKHVVTQNIPDQPQKIMMNVWICNITSWAGKFDPNVLPVFAEYDYVKYYKMK